MCACVHTFISFFHSSIFASHQPERTKECTVKHTDVKQLHTFSAIQPRVMHAELNYLLQSFFFPLFSPHSLLPLRVAVGLSASPLFLKEANTRLAASRGCLIISANRTRHCVLPQKVNVLGVFFHSHCSLLMELYFSQDYAFSPAAYLLFLLISLSSYQVLFSVFKFTGTYCREDLTPTLCMFLACSRLRHNYRLRY